jgi:hypothetical protein
LVGDNILCPVDLDEVAGGRIHVPSFTLSLN